MSESEPLSGFEERQNDDTGDEYYPGPDPVAVEFETPDDPDDDPDEDPFEVTREGESE